MSLLGLELTTQPICSANVLLLLSHCCQATPLPPIHSKNVPALPAVSAVYPRQRHINDGLMPGQLLGSAPCLEQRVVRLVLAML